MYQDLLNTMKGFFKSATKPSVLLVTSALMTGCGGNGLGSGTDADANTDLTIGISDSPVENAKEVVIQIESITLEREGDDIVFDEFEGGSETASVDLLAFQGTSQFSIISNEEVPTGNYSNFIIDINDGGIEESYLIDDEDVTHEIKVPSGRLRLGAFSLDDPDNEALTVEFSLRKALAERPGNSPDGFNLKPRGVRLVNNNGISSLSGSVDSELFDTDDNCADKTEPTNGNVIYLFENHNLNPAQLSDIYDPDVDQGVTTINPFDAVSATQNDETSVWEYEFGFLPAGNYTLVFSCNAENDNPETHDGFELPIPNDQLVQVIIEENTNNICNLPIADNDCGS